jgi:hypothetical protein
VDAFPTSSDTHWGYVALEVVTPNTAPVLDATQSPVLATISTTATAPTNGNTTAGVLVSSLVTGVSDADSGATQGIAITAAASGTLYYSLNGGTTWLSIASTSLTNTNALLLAADANTRVYFQPTTLTAGTTAGALTFRAWDMTQHITEGVLADTAANGGKAQFSTTTDTVALTVVNPVAMSSVAISSATGIQNNTLNAGDVVTASVTYASAVTVSGAPTLSMVVGGTTVQATYDAANSTATVLKFNYTVLATQADANGISIAANALQLNGGSIIGNSNGLSAALTNTLVSDNASYMVDTSNPTATLTSTGTLGTLQSAVVQSSEVGTAYLVDSTATVSTEADILALADARFNSVSIATAATATNMAMAGLNTGNYKLYTADNAGNLSAASGSSVNVEQSINPVELSAIASGTGGFVINGRCAGDQSGWSVAAAGDVNGDGLADLLIGANLADPAGLASAGATYVVFGSTAAAAVDLSAVAAGTGGFVINGGCAGDQAGYAVSAAGDLNGDGLADVLVGAPLTDNSGSNYGRAFVVFGKTNGTAVNIPTTAISNTDVAYIAQGSFASSELGTAVALAGDVDGDGQMDLLLGSPKNNSSTGTVMLMYGGLQGPVGSGTWGTIKGLLGETTTVQLGYSVSSAGDVNGDGLADLLMSAPYVDPAAGADAGRTYVVFSRTDRALPTIAAIAAGGTGGFVINGQSAGDLSGTAVSKAGDVNGDGLADLLVSAWNADPAAGTNAGRTYVVFGKTSIAAVNLSDVAAGTGGFVLNGQGASDQSGFDVSDAGDINGDGLADLLVSANKSDPAAGTDAGRTYVVFGTTSTAAMNLSDVAQGVGGFVILGASAGDESGYSVAKAGDVNGDGYADLLIGAYKADASAGTDAGRTYVVYGGSQYGDGSVVVTGSGTVTGTAASEWVVGSAGADVLASGGGVDRLSAGEGDDVLVLTVSDDTALHSNATGGFKAMFNGGGGTDTLRLSGTDLNVANIPSAAVGEEGASRISSIERVDMTSDSGGNTLTLSARAVADMAGQNLYNTSNGWSVVSGTGFGAVNTRHQWLIEGDSLDTVNATDIWVNAGVVSKGGSNYTVYNSSEGFSQLLVRQGVQIGFTVSNLPDVNLGSVTMGSGGFVINGASANDGNGMVASNAGDVNGDGIDDVLLGFMSANSQKGRSYVVFGRTDNVAVQLSNVLAGAGGGFVINGGDPIFGSNPVRAGQGISSVGDLNGDGLADFVVGSPYTDLSNTQTAAGRAYVIYGKTSSAAVELSAMPSNANSMGFYIQGNTAWDFVGGNIKNVGDVNGDGFDDLLIGSGYSYDGTATWNTGQAWVVFGNTSSAAIMVTSLTGSLGYVIHAQSAGDNLGSSVSNAGDVNGDGLADMIVGSYASDPATGANAGRSYVIFGKTGGGTTLNISSIGQSVGVGGFVINGESGGDYSGYTVSAAGDVNGDGLADVVVSAQYALTVTGTQGRAYVVFGKTGTNEVNLSSITAGVGGYVINTEPILGATNQMKARYVGDINGDGLSDMIVTGLAPSAAGVSGTEYVVFGQSGGTAIELSTIAAGGTGGFTIYGQAHNDTASVGSYAGDVNGDGFADLLITASGGDPSASLVNAGRAYVVYGGTQFATGVTTVVGAGTVTGSASSELVVGSTGADVLTGGGGIDRFMAGAGNDVVVLSSTDVTNLANNTAAALKAVVNGGNGIDTLRLTGGASLDLTTISNVAAGVNEGGSRINSIERIDLATDGAANTLKLSANDVIDMSGSNVFNSGNGWALGATVVKTQLVVDGIAGDVLNLKGAASTWSLSTTVTNGGNTYKVYVNSATSVQVIADQRMTINLNVAPVVFDLNRDGTLSYGQVTMDVNGDGYLDNTQWASAGDGVLVWNKYADGLVHNNSQYAFSQYATTRYTNAAGQVLEPTDLQGLADAFDSNFDGVFNAADAKFAEFSVWRDINQNGVSDAGEVRSLSDWGIAEINLSSDGVVRTPTAGVTEAGRTTATATDGTRVLVSDAGFEYSSLAYSSETVAGLGTHIDLLGSGMSLDLSSVIAVHANVAEVNTSGTGANTLKIHLGDVLQGTPAGVLQVTGDADDTAVIKADEWLSTGNVVADHGHNYAVFNAANGAAAQLLIDQHMLQQLV